MCKIYEREGGLYYPARRNATIREVEAQGKIWLENVKGILDDIVSGKSTTFTLAAIPKLLNAYDFYYSICNGESANDYIRGIRLSTAGLWAKGDKSISETDLVLELLKEVKRDNRTLDSKYSMFALGVLGDWVKDLTSYGEFRNIPKSEAYSRLNYIINDDLFAYLGTKEQASAKARWISTYTLSETELDTLDADTLWAYIGFAQSALFFNRKFDEFEESLMSLFSKLMARDDIPLFVRKAIEIHLSKSQIA
ncbi:hypothetical protein [Bacteroides caecimuris]|nr:MULTISPECIES: hypothetical protein [Bacteroides]